MEMETKTPLLKILGIESSCDDTGVALCEGSQVRASLVSSQLDIHRPFGGVVPEIAPAHVRIDAAGSADVCRRHVSCLNWMESQSRMDRTFRLSAGGFVVCQIACVCPE